MTTSRGDAEQEQTVNLLRNLGFARTDEQAAAYREQLAASAVRRTPEYWEQLRARLGVNTHRAA
jgi:hypothetical protein